MNKEEIDDWLRYFSNHNHGFMSEDGKKITLFKVFQELKELQQENQSLKKENKILRENAEHNDKVVDKFNWENQKLKKQLEEYKRLCFVHLINKCNKLENQQKEFINYLTSYIELLSDDPDYVEEGQKEILEEVLLKYKEMVSNNVNIER